MMSSMAKSSSSSPKKKKQRLMNVRNTNDAKRRRVGAAEDEAYSTTARALLEEKGFDLDDLNKRNEYGWTPLTYFSYKGNVTMIRYLIARGADCRKTHSGGSSPLLMAACSGHLAVIKLLCHRGGAHEDIWRVNTVSGNSPLHIAFNQGHFEVVYWLILNGALALRDDMDIGGIDIDDAIMRSDLRQGRIWREDRRLPILSWARDAVATHDNVVSLLVTGMIVRTNNQESSLLVTFKGTSGILELIARFVAGTQQQLHTQRQVMDRLSTFIDDTPFVEEDDWVDDWDDEEEDDSDDEEDY